MTDDTNEALAGELRGYAGRGCVMADLQRLIEAAKEVDT